MKKLLFLALVLAVVSLSHQAKAANTKPKAAAKAKLHVVKPVSAPKAATKNLKPKAASVKPAVKTPKKAGKHNAKPSKEEQKAKKKVAEQKIAVKKAAQISNIQNTKIQNDLSKDRDELKGKLRTTRMEMRNQRKIRDDAKLNKKADDFIKAKKAVIAAKDKIHATKINLKRTVKELSDAHAKILKNKMTLQKVTGKKAAPSRRKPHDRARLQAQMTVIERRRKKIFHLQNRLAKNTVVMDYAQSQKGKKAGALELRLTKRIDRLSKRLARKKKELMNVLKRRHRTNPHFKLVYKKFADRAYKLAKADEPKEMTKKQKVKVLNLKNAVNKLYQDHKVLVGKKKSNETQST